MVAKINIGNSLYGALSYNGKKINEGEGKLLLSHKIFDAGTGELHISRAINDFNRYLPSQMRTEKPVIHISLNPHPDDRLSDMQLSEIAREYMDKLGYGNQPYIVFKHEDIDRHHLHIVSIRVGLDGKRLNNDYIHRRSKRITDALETKYALTPARKKQDIPKYPLKRINVQEGNLKSQISNILKYASTHYRFRSMSEYRALLSLYGVTVDEVRGEVSGREFRGLVYLALNQKGEKTGHPIKSSRIGIFAGIEALESHFLNSKNLLKNKSLVEHSRTEILACFHAAYSMRMFTEALRTKGIDPVFRLTDTGRIYGVTFVDHNRGYIFNGSHLGKELSANALQEYFAEHKSRPSVQPNSPHENNESETIRPDNSNEDADSSLGLFAIETNATDPEEERFRHRMQNRKKRKRLK